MLNYATANAEMKSHFYTKWLDGINNGLPNENPPIAALSLQDPSGNSYTPEIEWQNVQQRDYEDKGEHWVRFTSQNVIRAQKSLTGGRAAEIGTRYTTLGVIIVQLFLSKIAYATDEADALGLILQRALSGSTANGLIFRNAVIRELDPEENFYRVNVTAEYEYDSIIK